MTNIVADIARLLSLEKEIMEINGRLKQAKAPSGYIEEAWIHTSGAAMECRRAATLLRWTTQKDA